MNNRVVELPKIVSYNITPNDVQLLSVTQSESKGVSVIAMGAMRSSGRSYRSYSTSSWDFLLAVGPFGALDILRDVANLEKLRRVCTLCALIVRASCTVDEVSEYGPEWRQQQQAESASSRAVEEDLSKQSKAKRSWKRKIVESIIRSRVTCTPR